MGPTEPSDDDELRERLLAARAGDRAAQERLLRDHLDDLRAFVRLRSGARLRLRESTSDLVQSVCREVLADLPRTRFEDAARFRSWLFTVALNKVREKGRFHGAERRDPAREATAPEGGLAPPQRYGSLVSPSEAAVGEETRQRLEAAFDRLSEEHREVILLSRVLGLPHAEIAARTGRSVVATRSLLSRALVALSGELDAG